MATKPVVAISFKDIAVNESVRETLDLACARLAEEFPEITRFELTLSPDGSGFAVHAHVTGRNTDVPTHAQAPEIGEAAHALVDKLERQLRKVHDKHIFSPRRDAQKDPAKRRNGE